MPLAELPHTRGCLACGRENPHGLHLDLHVDPATGAVSCSFTPRVEHIGFEGIVHGGVLATVLDEVMVWAATWSGKRFCVCGELNVRLNALATIGQPVEVRASVVQSRARLIQTDGTILDAAGNVLVTSTAKYVPLAPDKNRAFVATLVDDPQTARTAQALKHAADLTMH
jgi:acyl-coenzyme A thioesterase PaaI-like protein